MIHDITCWPLRARLRQRNHTPVVGECKKAQRAADQGPVGPEGFFRLAPRKRRSANSYSRKAALTMR